MPSPCLSVDLSHVCIAGTFERDIKRIIKSRKVIVCFESHGATEKHTNAYYLSLSHKKKIEDTGRSCYPMRQEDRLGGLVIYI